MFSMSFILMLMTSILFLFLSNPLAMGLTLILQTIFISFFLGSMIKSFWFMYMLILIYVGGMLVLFIYVTSIFPNNKFFFNQFTGLMIFLLIMILFLSVLVSNNFFNLNFIFLDFKNNYLMDLTLSNSLTMKMFFYKTNLMMIFLVIYLFYCMLVVIKITSFMNGPLRKMN